METKYKLLDPASMGNDPQYTTVGPYAICSTLQEEHGKLISDSDWPALSTKLPESNSATTEMQTKEPDSPLQNKIQCYKCKQWGHKANDPRCPLFRKKDDTEGATKSTRFKPKEPWKYTEPKDLTKPIVIDDKEWYFCSKCKCRATGRLGYYQLSHTDATHDPNWRPESNLSPITDPDPTPAPTLRPPIESHVLDDDLVFTGVNHAPIEHVLGTIDEREELTVLRATEAALLRIRRLVPQGTVHHVIQTPGSRYDDAKDQMDQMDQMKENNACKTRHSANCVPVLTAPYSIQSMSKYYVADSTDSSSKISSPKFKTCIDHLTSQYKIYNVFMNMVSNIPLQILLIFMFILMNMQYWLKYEVLYVTSMYWSCVREFIAFTSTSTNCTKRTWHGFPAKWLVLTTVMFSPTFWNSTSFSVISCYDKIVHPVIVHRLSAELIAQDSRCTWKFLCDYNYDKLSEVYHISAKISNMDIHTNGIRENFQVKTFKSNNNNTNDDCDLFVDAKSESDPNHEQFFFESSEEEQSGKELQLEFLRTTTHVINTLRHMHMDQILEGNNAPTVSIEAGLELLRPAEIEINTAIPNYQPIIMDTGASLAITGSKQDFVPDSYQEVTSLKFGGMAAGANIAGVGNVVWTFPCDNGDQMAIVLTCYFVPSANTRLLSP